MADIKTIRVVIDKSQADAGLTDLSANAQRAQQNLKGMNTALKDTSSTSNQAKTEAEKLMTTIKNQAAAFGKTKEELAQIRTAQLGVGQSAQPMIDALKNQGDALGKVSKIAETAKQEMADLAKEAVQGSWKNVGESMTALGGDAEILGRAFGAVGTAGTAAGITLGALAVVGGVVGMAFLEASHDTKEFNKALASTNNSAGLTRDSVKEMAEQAALSARVGFGTATDAVIALAKSGAYTAEQMKSMSKIVINESILTGQSIEEVTKSFDKLADSPSKFSEEINKTRHIFSAAQLEQINLLERSGQKTEAANLAMKAWTAYQNGPAKAAIEEQKGLIGQLSEAWGDLWHSIKVGIGAEKLPLQKQLENLNNEIDRLQREGADSPQMQYDELGNAIGDTINPRLSQALEERRKVLKQMAEETKKASHDASEALKSSLGQGALDYFRGLGVKGAESLKIALDEFERQVRHLRMANPDSEFLKPSYLAAARNKVIEDNQNPLIEQQRKQNYDANISTLDGYIQQEDRLYQTRSEMIKAYTSSGYISQQEAIERDYTAKKEALKKDADYVENKIALAEVLAKATNNKDGIQAAAQFRAQLADIRAQELVEEAKYNATKQANARQLKDTYDALIRNIQKYREDASNAFNRSVRRQSMSNNEIGMDDSLEQVTAYYKNLKSSTLIDYKNKNASGSQAELDSIKAIEEAERQDIKTAREMYQTKIDMQRDWRNSAIKTFKDYSEQSQNIAAMTAQGINSVMNALNDQIANALDGANFSLQSLLKSIQHSLNKFTANQITGALTDSLSYLFTGRAAGGPVSAGTDVLVGENGPEILRMPFDGFVVPNNVVEGAKQTSQVYAPNVNVSTTIHAAPGMDEEMIARKVKAQVLSTVYKQTGSNGLFRG